MGYAAYERGRKSPTLRTLRRLARAAGFEARIEFHPPLTREECRSLALHRTIADRLSQEPESVLERADIYRAFGREEGERS